MSPAVRLELERQLGLPAGMLDVDTHATADAPPRPAVRGVLLMQHGGNTLAAFQTGQVADLASRGWAVVTMEHPHESFAIEEPDGTLIAGSADTAPFTDRIVDGSLVLAALPRLVPQATPRTPIGMFGHSRGGAATAEMMLHHPGIAAGVDADGGPRGDVLTAGLDRPLGFLLGVEQPVASLAPFLAVLRGPHPVRELPVNHYGFTDWVVLLPQVEVAVPGLGAALEQVLPSGTAGDPGAGRRSLDTQRHFLSSFFDRFLRTQ
jgi:alpha-beta hydrolase superfamily lysophospholipase